MGIPSQGRLGAISRLQGSGSSVLAALAPSPPSAPFAYGPPLRGATRPRPGRPPPDYTLWLRFGAVGDLALLLRMDPPESGLPSSVPTILMGSLLR